MPLKDRAQALHSAEGLRSLCQRLAPAGRAPWSQGQREAARVLAVDDRSLRRWLAGEHAIPLAVVGFLLAVVEEREGSGN